VAAPGPPVEIEVGQHHRQDHPPAHRDERVEQGAGAGLGADGDVRRDGRRATYLRRLDQVLGDGAGTLGDLQQRPATAGGDELVAQGCLAGGEPVGFVHDSTLPACP